ncbi:MAG: hypothetical protein V3T72_19815 [Thermoanaerobaculia bacterium]
MGKVSKRLSGVGKGDRVPAAVLMPQRRPVQYRRRQRLRGDL